MRSAPAAAPSAPRKRTRAVHPSSTHPPPPPLPFPFSLPPRALLPRQLQATVQELPQLWAERNHVQRVRLAAVPVKTKAQVVAELRPRELAPLTEPTADHVKRISKPRQLPGIRTKLERVMLLTPEEQPDRARRTTRSLELLAQVNARLILDREDAAMAARRTVLDLPGTSCRIELPPVEDSPSQERAKLSHQRRQELGRTSLPTKLQVTEATPPDEFGKAERRFRRTVRMRRAAAADRFLARMQRANQDRRSSPVRVCLARRLRCGKGGKRGEDRGREGKGVGHGMGVGEWQARGPWRTHAQLHGNKLCPTYCKHN